MNEKKENKNKRQKKKKKKKERKKRRKTKNEKIVLTVLLYAALVLQPSGYQAFPPTCIQPLSDHQHMFELQWRIKYQPHNLLQFFLPNHVW